MQETRFMNMNNEYSSGYTSKVIKSYNSRSQGLWIENFPNFFLSRLFKVEVRKILFYFFFELKMHKGFFLYHLNSNKLRYSSGGDKTELEKKEE